MTNYTDITNLTDAALDVVLAVKSGEECVVVEHLSFAERLAVCTALGITAPSYWLTSAPYSTKPASKRVARDYEGMILDRQDIEENGEY